MDQPDISIESLVKEFRTHARADDVLCERRIAEAGAVIAQRAAEAGEHSAFAIRASFLL